MNPFRDLVVSMISATILLSLNAEAINAVTIEHVNALVPERNTGSPTFFAAIVFFVAAALS